MLCRAWCGVLGVERPEPTVSFFETGGDSLRSLQLRSTLTPCGLRLVACPDLFAHPTIRALAPRLRWVASSQPHRPREPFALLSPEGRPSVSGAKI